jgi:uncharacterized protein YfbU (UPF0304 family)
MLYPEGQARHFAEKRKLVEQGYALDYEWLTDFIRTEMSEDECMEVRDILEMHRALEGSAEAAGIDPEGVRFRGFDGNREPKQISYATYLLKDQVLWRESQHGQHSYNSLFPLLSCYRAMLRKWKEDLGKPTDLTKEEIEQVLEAGRRCRSYDSGPPAASDLACRPGCDRQPCGRRGNWRVRIKPRSPRSGIRKLSRKSASQRVVDSDRHVSTIALRIGN